MTLTELKNKLKTSDISGAYIFCGEEDYLKKYYLSEFVKISCPDDTFSLFNKVIFDSAEISIADIAEAIKSPPMMSDNKIVIWKYPQIDKSTESEKKLIEDLASSLSDYPYASLVLFSDADSFDPGTSRRPSKLASRLAKHYNIINFEKSTDAQLIGWLKRHFDANGILVDNDTLSALIFRSGHGMELLKNEVDKLSAYAKANSLTSIGRTEVDFVASSTLECDAFALSGAITDKNRERAFLALSDMMMRRVDSGEALAMLSRSFSDLITVALLLEEGKDATDMESILKWNPYKIKLSITAAKKWGSQKLREGASRLRELDAQSKSGGPSGYKMLEIFVCQYL